MIKETFNNLPCRKSPCKDCPFRKDSLKGWLGKERMTGILKQSSFVCHKNINLQCAGHMIIRKNANEFYRLAKSMNIPLKLKNENLIFNNEGDCIEHHKFRNNEKNLN